MLLRPDIALGRTQDLLFIRIKEGNSLDIAFSEKNKSSVRRKVGALVALVLHKREEEEK